MNRPILVCALMFLTTAALGAQDASQSSPYQGTSTPPPDDAIVTSDTPQAKPPAGHRASPAIMPVEEQAPPSTAAIANNTDSNGGMAAVQQNVPAQRQPSLTQRPYVDPDSDIVHPRPLRPGELPEGTNIRIRLMDGLSTVSSEKGEVFRGRVASDVLLADRVVIPAGSEIDGRVAEVSSGHAGGHGSMHLRPETVTLPDGRRFQLQAEITGTPGSRTRVGNEGTILPDSRLRRDEIEYGGAVGAGATTGAILGGPVGALAGTMVGAGVITVHLLVSHPQATLEPDTALLLTLTEPLQMAPVNSTAAREN